MAEPSIWRDAAVTFGQAVAASCIRDRADRGLSGRVWQIDERSLAASLASAFELGAGAGERRAGLDLFNALRSILHLIEGGHDEAAQREIAALLERSYETAARVHGWHRSKADPRLIVHALKPYAYETWRECCEAEDLKVPA